MTKPTQALLDAISRSGFELTDGGEGEWSLERYMPSGMRFGIFVDDDVDEPIHEQILGICAWFQDDEAVRDRFKDDNPIYVKECFKELANAVTFAHLKGSKDLKAIMGRMKTKRKVKTESKKCARKPAPKTASKKTAPAKKAPSKNLKSAIGKRPVRKAPAKKVTPRRK